MKENRSAYEQANDYVKKVEEQWLATAFLDLANALHKADSCGCPNCKKKPDTLNGVIADEISRLSIPETERRQARVYTSKQVNDPI